MNAKPTKQPGGKAIPPPNQRTTKKKGGKKNTGEKLLKSTLKTYTEEDFKKLGDKEEIVKTLTNANPDKFFIKAYNCLLLAYKTKLNIIALWGLYADDFVTDNYKTIYKPISEKEKSYRDDLKKMNYYVKNKIHTKEAEELINKITEGYKEILAMFPPDLEPNENEIMRDYKGDRS